MTGRLNDWQRLSRLLDAHEQSLVGADDAEIAGLPEAAMLEAEVRDIAALSVAKLVTPTLRRGLRANSRLPSLRAPTFREVSKLRGASFGPNMDQDDEDEGE